jgi:SAM-dependent methyltransferase
VSHLEAPAAAGPTPLELYARALASAGPLRAVRGGCDGGALPLRRWLSPPSGAEQALLAALPAPVLDVGSGPGRHVSWLQVRGVPALGVELSPVACRLARRRGARVRHGSIFDPVPAAGSWGSVLLLDGNLGIGGDPERLLRRVGELVRPGGVIVAELECVGRGRGVVEVRLEHAGVLSRQFPWAFLGSADLEASACRAGLAIVDTWRAERRWFARLERPRDVGSNAGRRHSQASSAG